MKATKPKTKQIEIESKTKRIQNGNDAKTNPIEPQTKRTENETKTKLIRMETKRSANRNDTKATR